MLGDCDDAFDRRLPLALTGHDRGGADGDIDTYDRINTSADSYTSRLRYLPFRTSLLLVHAKRGMRQR
jgi:hypothetical protein